MASRVLAGEQRGCLRGGGARVRAGHVSGPAAARLRGTRGGGLLLQQEPRGQGAGLHADAGGGTRPRGTSTWLSSSANGSVGDQRGGRDPRPGGGQQEPALPRRPEPGPPPEHGGGARPRPGGGGGQGGGAGGEVFTLTSTDLVHCLLFDEITIDTKYTRFIISTVLYSNNISYFCAKHLLYFT